MAPPKPVSLTKGTAAREHHFVSPNLSLKHKTTTTHLSFLRPSPGIKFGVAATTTGHAEYRDTAGGRRGLRLASPPHLQSLRRLPKLTCGGEPTADPDSAPQRSARAASRGSGRRQQQAVLRPPGTPSRARRDVRHPGLEEGGTPPKKREKELQHCTKVGLTSQATMAAAGASGTGGSRPRRRPPGGGGNQAAERTPAPRYPPPPGLDSRFVESLKRLRPPGTHKNAPRNLNPSPF